MHRYDDLHGTTPQRKVRAMLTKRFKTNAPQRLNQAAWANLRKFAQLSRRERDRDRFNPRGRRIARRNLFALVFTDCEREFDGFTGHR